MKRLGFREVDKVHTRSKIRKFSQNFDSKVDVLPTASYCLACSEVSVYRGRAEAVKRTVD